MPPSEVVRQIPMPSGAKTRLRVRCREVLRPARVRVSRRRPHDREHQGRRREMERAVSWRNPGRVCYISQSQVSFLSTGRVFSPFMLADTPQRKGRAGEVIDRIRRAQTRPNLLADRQMAATFLAPGTFFPMRPYYSSAAFMTAWSRPCAAEGPRKPLLSVRLPRARRHSPSGTPAIRAKPSMRIKAGASSERGSICSRRGSRRSIQTRSTTCECNWLPSPRSISAG